jgi:alanyl-tRNA synthetase
LSSSNETIEIIDTKKENNLILHFATTLPENLEGTFIAKVDKELRSNTAGNHSATHLMHLALRTVLGKHVEQKGSLVSPNYLRFDFSHFAKVTDEELKQVEDFVNARIQEQLPLVERRSIPFAQAVEEGAMALFGEKYGDHVRAIKFGDSMELCGGIHVNNTAEIWHFKIISEGAVAAGIRRIEAITGEAVKRHFTSQEKALDEIKGVLKNPQDSLKAVISLQEENTKLKKQVEQFRKEKLELEKQTLSQEYRLLNGVNFLAKQVFLDSGLTKDLAFASGSTQSNSITVLASVDEGIPSLSCYVSRDLVESRNFSASKIIQELGKYIDGKGGGQPTLASGKGKDANGIPVALEHAADLIK